MIKSVAQYYSAQFNTREKKFLLKVNVSKPGFNRVFPFLSTEYYLQWNIGGLGGRNNLARTFSQVQFLSFFGFVWQFSYNWHSRYSFLIFVLSMRFFCHTFQMLTSKRAFYRSKFGRDFCGNWQEWNEWMNVEWRRHISRVRESVNYEKFKKINALSHVLSLRL